MCEFNLMNTSLVLLLQILLGNCSDEPFMGSSRVPCKDSSPGVCCKEPAGTCGLAKCLDYQIVAPLMRQEDIRNFGCQGASNCCFYLANGGAYCKSCLDDTSEAEGHAEQTRKCRDAVPGVCCQEPATTCGVAKCADYKKVAPAMCPEDIQNFMCKGATNCCFYQANGGAYCKSCSDDANKAESYAVQTSAYDASEAESHAVQTSACKDAVPGVCCQEPASTCGVAKCVDYKKVAPALHPEEIQHFMCDGATNCCFYLANGGAYCKSCSDDARKAESHAVQTSACKDAVPGICCQEPASTCGVAKCIDYKKVAPALRPEDIQNFMCHGATNCCFYFANGGAFCESCSDDARKAESHAVQTSACKDAVPGVCCQDPASTCGMAKCVDYKKVAPALRPEDIQNFMCQGATNCCFYLANGGAYCKSCSDDARKAESHTVQTIAYDASEAQSHAVQTSAAESHMVHTSSCKDAVPGVCCQEPASTCGVAKCADYKKVAPAMRPEDIQNFMCHGATNCCIYLANGGAYCKSCSDDANKAESHAVQTSAYDASEAQSHAVQTSAYDTSEAESHAVQISACKDAVPGVCCQQPASTCGVAKCVDYKKVAPALCPDDIQNFMCQGAADCCFYLANGGAYCKSCSDDARKAESYAVQTSACKDAVPGVCCQDAARTCGVAKCADYKKVAPAMRQEDIHNFGCKGAFANCCFYLASGGAYCTTCAGPPAVSMANHTLYV